LVAPPLSAAAADSLRVGSFAALRARSDSHPMHTRVRALLTSADLVHARRDGQQPRRAHEEVLRPRARQTAATKRIAGVAASRRVDAASRRAAWMPRRVCRAAGGRVVAAAEPIPERAPRVPTRPRQVRVARLASRCFFYFRCSSRPVHCSAQAVEVPFWKAAKEWAMRTGGLVLWLWLWGRLGSTHGPRLPLSAIAGARACPGLHFKLLRVPSQGENTKSPVLWRRSCALDRATAGSGVFHRQATRRSMLWKRLNKRSYAYTYRRILPCPSAAWRNLTPGDKTEHGVAGC
jgi:hypothetical protein